VKKYKQFMIGFLVGAMLFSSIGVFAEGITVLLNPFTMLFNGQPAQIEAYNINGRTFLSLGDIANYMGATVKLNEATKEIEINTNTESIHTLNVTQNETYGINETASNDKLEITLLSIDYQDYPADESGRGYWYFSDSSVNMGLIKYKIKNITDHDIKIPFPHAFKDEYREKRTKGFFNTMIIYAPNYCSENSIGYSTKSNTYLKPGKELILTIDTPVDKLESIKSVVIDNLVFVP
jgi:hypothetical protein